MSAPTEQAAAADVIEVKTPAAAAAAAADEKHEDDMDKLFSAFVNAANGGEKKEYSYEDFQQVLNSTPLFMRETPDQITEENSYVLEALKSLAFEGDGDEIAGNFKQHGNELYAQKSFTDAIQAYSSGLDAKPTNMTLRITLLNNRAAANVSLRKWPEVLKDTSAIIALCATNADASARDPPPKSLYRAAQALVGLEKWDEAEDAISRGRALPGEDDKAWWPKIADEAVAGRKRSFERKERARREQVTEEALQMAVVAHGLMVEKTSQPPDNPNPLHFDPANLTTDTPLYPPEAAAEWPAPQPYTPLIFPVFLMYPQHSTSDFITHFHEDTTFEQQLEPIFPANPSASSPPWSDWDKVHEYHTDNLVVYVETQQRRLLKISKELTLREVITKARKDPVASTPRDGIVLRDGLLSFVILPKGPEERKFIDAFKLARDGKK